MDTLRSIVFSLMLILSLFSICRMANSKELYLGSWENKKINLEIAQDNWIGDDKGFHAFGGWALTNTIDRRLNLKQAIIVVQIISLCWELKDGFLNYKKHEYLGGDGFSYKDHIAVSIGQIVYVIVNYYKIKKLNKIPLELKKDLYYQY